MSGLLLVESAVLLLEIEGSANTLAIEEPGGILQLTLASENAVLTMEGDALQIVSMAEQGPPGPIGPSGAFWAQRAW